MLNTSFKQNANKDKAVLYLRYSSESQTENSIEGQRRECGAYAKQKGIQVIGEYIDRAKTGMSDERPDFQRMIRDSFSKGFGNVIVWKSDRFARDMADAINYQRKLMDNGVKLLSVTEPNLEGPIATLMNSISLGMNQYYSEELSVKVKRGVRENVINGKQIGGKPPFGYDYDGEGHYVVNPIEGPIISDVFRMYGIEKKSIFEIVRTLNQEGKRQKNGNPITHGLLERSLKSEKYVGVLKCEGARNEDAIPPLVDRALWEKCQERRKKRAHSRYRKRNTDDAYWLSGKVYCEECGGLLRGEAGTSSTGKVYTYYKCENAKHHKCSLKPIPKNELEEEVASDLLAILSETKFARPIANAICEMQGKGSPALESIQKRLGQVEKEIHNVMTAIKMGIITDSTKEELLKLESEKKELEKRKDEESLGQRRFTREQIEMALKVLAGKSISDVRQRRALLETFVDKITIGKDGNVTITWDIFGYNPGDVEGLTNAINVRISDRIARHLIYIRTLSFTITGSVLPSNFISGTRFQMSWKVNRKMITSEMGCFFVGYLFE